METNIEDVTNDPEVISINTNLPDNKSEEAHGSIKEPLEILSVELVKVASDVEHQMIVNEDAADIEEPESKMEAINNLIKQEMSTTIPPMNPQPTTTVEKPEEMCKSLPAIISNPTESMKPNDVSKDLDNSIEKMNEDYNITLENGSNTPAGAAKESGDVLNNVQVENTAVEDSAIPETSNDLRKALSEESAQLEAQDRVLQIVQMEDEKVLQTANISSSTIDNDVGEKEDNNISTTDSLVLNEGKEKSITEKDTCETNTNINSTIIEESTSRISLPMDENLEKSVNETSTLNATVETNATINSLTGLSLLAQYGSEEEDAASTSDNDSVIEVQTSVQNYRNRVVEIDSGSDSDSSSSDSDVECLNKLRKTIERRMEVDDDDEEDDEEINGKIDTKSGTRKKPATKIKAKGEFQLEDLPPIQDLQITVPEEECIVLGKIHSIVDQLVLVSALPDSLLVDLDTVLFLDKGQRVLGEVFDVLGQVSDPLYCVRFNSNEQINEKHIQVNDVVYLAPRTPYTQYIILSSIMKQKGSDASWENDIEPPPKFLDYSDDEEQQHARRHQRNKDRPMDHDDAQKRLRRDVDEPQVSSYNRQNNSHPRQRYPNPHMNDNAGAPYRGSYNRSRPQYNNNPRQRFAPRIPLNHNPSSWHSNYYPHSYAARNTNPSNLPPYPGSYQRMPAPGPVPQFPHQVPMYPMAMSYPPPALPPQHITSTINRPPEHQQFMPNAFNMRPPSIPANFDMSAPPPGSQ